MQSYVESKECAIIRETLKSLDISLQRNSDMLNEFWMHPPIVGVEVLEGKEVCVPDRAKADKWYRNILKQLRGGRNVEAVFRQLMIVCQSYGFSLPAPPTRDATLRPTANLQQQDLEIHDLIYQIYTRISKHYCEALQTTQNQYQVIQTLTALSYVMSPTLMLAQFHSARLKQLNALLPAITASSDLLIFYTRIRTLLQSTRELLVGDMGVFLLGIFSQITEPNKIIRIVYLDRTTKELIAALQQLKSTNQLGTYFCDIVAECYELEQSAEHFLNKFAGLSLQEVVNTDADDADTPEFLWNWRLEVFAPHVESFAEKIAVEKQELLNYLDEIPPDFWLISPCKDECIFDHSACAVALGVHSVVCRLVKYNNLIKHLGDVAEFIAPQVSDEADSSTTSESLSDAVSSMTNEVLAATLLQAEHLSEKVPETRPLVDLYVCCSSLFLLEQVLPLSPTTRTVLQDTLDQLQQQACHVNNSNICNVILYEESAMTWSRNHTVEIKECSASLISLNLYLRVLYYDAQRILPRDARHNLLLVVVEHSLTHITRRYLAARPSRTNNKLFLFDITAIVMMYSTFVWLLTGEDAAQVTEPREGRLMVVYSNLNRLLAAMSVITAPLLTVLNAIKQLNKTAFNKTASVTRLQRESDTASNTTQVLPHDHATSESPAPTSWLPSVWLSSLYSIDNLDTTLLHVLRCYNNKIPDKRDLLLAAVSNGAKIPQQTQLYHNRETSQFDYNTVVLTMSRLLSCCKYDISAWSSFILTTFIPNELWNCISRPNFQFSRAGQAEDLWQECIGEVLMCVLEPILLEVVSLVVYRTKIMPSTDEEVAIEELPCSCRINRYSTPSLKLVLHEALRAVFTHISLITPSVKPVLFRLSRVLCAKAKLKDNSELPVLKLLIGFFLKRIFMNPNEICKKYRSVLGDCSNLLPWVDIPEDTLVILRKVGDTARLIVMKDVLNVIPLSQGVQKFLDEEQTHVQHCLLSLHDQLNISLTINSNLNSIQLDNDIVRIENTYPRTFGMFLLMINEITDIVSKDFSGFLKAVRLLPVDKLNPLVEYRSLGSFSVDDVAVKIWNYDRLSAEYYTTDILLRYLPCRWELWTDAGLPEESHDMVQTIKAFISKHS